MQQKNQRQTQGATAGTAELEPSATGGVRLPPKAGAESWAQKTGRYKAQNGRRKGILEFVRERGICEHREIAEGPGAKVKPRTLELDLASLLEMGALTRSDDGRYEDPSLKRITTYESEHEYARAYRHSDALIPKVSTARPGLPSMFHRDQGVLADLISGRGGGTRCLADHLRRGYPDLWADIEKMQEFYKWYSDKEEREGSPLAQYLVKHPEYDDQGRRIAPLAPRRRNFMFTDLVTDDSLEADWRGVDEFLGVELAEKVGDCAESIRDRFGRICLSLDSGNPLRGSCEACPNMNFRVGRP